MSMPPSYALAIHTSSPDLGLALGSVSENEHDSGDRIGVWELNRSQSTHIQSCLLDFLPPQTWAHLAFLAVAKGPGGFTGTRIGVVTARTIAQQLGIPLYGISSLAAMAQLTIQSDVQRQREISGKDIAVELPAHQGSVHGGIYRLERNHLFPIQDDRLLSVVQWQNRLTNHDRPYELCSLNGNLGYGVSGVLQLAKQGWFNGLRPHWSDVVPIYGSLPGMKPIPVHDLSDMP